MLNSHFSSLFLHKENELHNQRGNKIQTELQTNHNKVIISEAPASFTRESHILTEKVSQETSL